MACGDTIDPGVLRAVRQPSSGGLEPGSHGTGRPALESKEVDRTAKLRPFSALQSRAVLKSRNVRPEGPRGIPARRAASTLSVEMARQFQHAQLHQRVGF